MAVLGLVLAAADMAPVVTTVGGFDDGLVKVRVRDDSVEPAVEDILVGVGFVVIPIGIGGLGDVDVGCFTEGVLAGIDSSNFDVELRATITGIDYYRLVGEGDYADEVSTTFFGRLPQANRGGL